MPPFSLLSQVLQDHHIIILEDWLDFLGETPAALVLFTSGDLSLSEKLNDLATSRGCDFVDLGPVDPLVYKKDEMIYLKQQFAASPTDLACIIRLDVLPYRTGHEGWLSAAYGRQMEGGFAFITGTTNAYRADTELDAPIYRATQRVSNNFLMIDKALWAGMIEPDLPDLPDLGRWAVEGNIEHLCEAKGIYGLRVVNMPDLRMLHTQIWDRRLLKLREDSRAGVNVAGYIDGFTDDDVHPWDRYYQWPKDSALRRTRNALGRWRRRLLPKS